MADEKRVVLVYQNEPPFLIFSAIRGFFKDRLPARERNLPVEEHSVSAYTNEFLLALLRLAQDRKDVIVIEYVLLSRFSNLVVNGVWAYQRVGNDYAFSYFDGSFRDVIIREMTAQHTQEGR